VAGIGITTGKNDKITLNKYLETNVKGIYAVGDVLGDSMLAHVAMAEGMCAAENALGIPTGMDYKVVPRCVYSSPEVAGVGLTEAEAQARYGKLKVGRFPFSALSKAVLSGEINGLVKVIAEPKYNQVLGVSIIGLQATELIAEAALAIKLEATLEEIIATIHAHPTLAESLAEAALNAEGRGLHL
jgi:dihydrolipoamide dehydrogenase